MQRTLTTIALTLVISGCAAGSATGAVIRRIAGVAVAMPLTMFAFYVLSTDAGAPPFWQDQERLEGLTFSGPGLAF